MAEQKHPDRDVRISVEFRRLLDRIGHGLLEESLAGEGAVQPAGVDPPHRMLNAVDEHHRDEIGISSRPSGVADDRLLLPCDLQGIAHAGHDGASLITQVAARLTDQHDPGRGRNR